MPRLSNQHPKSLYKLCLRNITQNMEHVWCKDYIETYCKEKKFYLYVIGPFDLLRKYLHFACKDKVATDLTMKWVYYIQI